MSHLLSKGSMLGHEKTSELCFRSELNDEFAVVSYLDSRNVNLPGKNSIGLYSWKKIKLFLVILYNKQNYLKCCFYSFFDKINLYLAS